MSSTRILAVFLRQMFLLQHNWTRFCNLFVWITVDIFLWGFITRYLDVVSNSGFSFVPVFLGAVLLWDFLVRIQQGVILALFEDVWSQNFINFFASPLTIREYAAGIVFTSVVTGVAGFTAIFLLAALAFGYALFTIGFPLVFFLAVLFVSGLALGLFTAGIVLRFGPSAEWIAWPIPALLSPFAGVFYPIATLPLAFQMVAKFIPASYVFEGMRSVMSSGGFSPSALLVGAVLSLIYLFFAYRFFVFVYRFVIRTGLVTRFSAESE